MDGLDGIGLGWVGSLCGAIIWAPLCGSNNVKYDTKEDIDRDVAAKKAEETNKEQMLHDMEQQALEDYKVVFGFEEEFISFLWIHKYNFMKEKDIVESRDFTAKLYNNEPLPGTEQYVDR